MRINKEDIKPFAVGAGVLIGKRASRGLERFKTEAKEARENIVAAAEVAKDNGNKIAAAFVQVESAIDGAGGVVTAGFLAAHAHPVAGVCVLGWTAVKTAAPIYTAQKAKKAEAKED